jgi:rubrerythrin
MPRVGLLAPATDGDRRAVRQLAKLGAKQNFCSHKGRPYRLPGEENGMVALQGSRTDANLRSAFLGESESHRSCLSLAQAAETAGYRDLAMVLRTTAGDDAGYACGHLDYLVAGRDAATTSPSEKTAETLAAIVIAMKGEHAAMYPGMARTAREEGFEDIAEWFLTLARAGRSHMYKFRHALEGAEQARAASTTRFGW